MAIDQVHNETLKLLAGWLNAASVAVVGGGTVLPVLTYLLGKADAVWPESYILIICGVVGAGLHWLGQITLGGLQSE